MIPSQQGNHPGNNNNNLIPNASSDYLKSFSTFVSKELVPSEAKESLHRKRSESNTGSSEIHQN